MPSSIRANIHAATDYTRSRDREQRRARPWSVPDASSDGWEPVGIGCQPCQPENPRFNEQTQTLPSEFEAAGARLRLQSPPMALLTACLPQMLAVVQLHICDASFQDAALPIQSLKSLRELTITHCNLARAPWYLDENHPLQRLDLSHNNLTQLPALDRFFKLLDLDVSHNAISHIERGSDSLVGLDLSRNSIKAVNSALGRFPELSGLSLAYNDINAMSLQHAPTLVSLNVSGNPRLWWLPRVTDGSHALRQLSVDGCALGRSDRAAPWERFPKLQLLSAVECGISEIEQLVACTELVEANLQRNPIANLPPLTRQTHPHLHRLEAVVHAEALPSVSAELVDELTVLPALTPTQRANTLWARGESCSDAEEKLYWWESAVAAHPADLDRQCLLAKMYQNLSMDEEALATCEDVLRRAPQQQAAKAIAGTVRTTMGARLLATRHLEAAEATLRLALALAPEHSRGWYYLSQTLLALGEPRDAAACGLRAYGLEMSYLYENGVGDCVEAFCARRGVTVAHRIELLQNVLRDCESGPLVRRLALLYEESGEHEKCAQQWRNLAFFAQSEPQGREAYQAAGEAYIRLARSTLESNSTAYDAIRDSYQLAFQFHPALREDAIHRDAYVEVLCQGARMVDDKVKASSYFFDAESLGITQGTSLMAVAQFFEKHNDLENAAQYVRQGFAAAECGVDHLLRIHEKLFVKQLRHSQPLHTQIKTLQMLDTALAAPDYLRTAGTEPKISLNARRQIAKNATIHAWKMRLIPRLENLWEKCSKKEQDEGYDQYATACEYLDRAIEKLSSPNIEESIEDTQAALADIRAAQAAFFTVLRTLGYVLSMSRSQYREAFNAMWEPVMELTNDQDVADVLARKEDSVRAIFSRRANELRTV